MNNSTRLASVFWSGLVGLAIFTFAVNMLLLVQPIYMLQIYDRVLTSASVETLLFISIIAAAALLLLGVLDSIRNLLAGRLAAKMEVAAGADALVASINGPRASIGDVQPLRDLGVVRNFISGRAIFGYLDLPFTPIFIFILYLIHPDLFWITVAGAVVLFAMAAGNEWLTRRSAAEATDRGLAATLSAQSFVRNAESLKAMGMVGSVIQAWGREESVSLTAQEGMNRTNSLLTGVSRTLRLGLQLSILGYGGFLVLEGELTAGMIFAATIISGRGLQPIDQVIGGWKGLIEARRAWKRLHLALGRSVPREPTQLPQPVGRLELEQIVVLPPNDLGGEPLLKRVSARIEAGSCVAVIGPSGAGKTTLMRTVVGAMEPRSGTVRVDGADIRNYDPEQLGRHVGYLAQDVELLPGTIAQNIARFDQAAGGAEIVAAAQKAQVHDLILRLPNGYDTRIGPGGLQLSGGQRQRVGLARALFRGPKILVLDEPNANLDTDGDLALERALAAAKEDGVTVLIVTQRRAITERADLIMILREGVLEDFGPRLEVFARQAARARAAQESQEKTAAPAVVTGRFPTVVYEAKHPTSSGAPAGAWRTE